MTAGSPLKMGMALEVHADGFVYPSNSLASPQLPCIGVSLNDVSVAGDVVYVVQNNVVTVPNLRGISAVLGQSLGDTDGTGRLAAIAGTPSFSVGGYVSAGVAIVVSASAITMLVAPEYNPTAGGGAAVSSVFGRTGAVVAANGDYSVGQVTGAAPLASPALTGTPTAPTQAPSTNNTDIATTAYSDAAVLVESTRALAAEALLAPIASPSFTGTVTLPTNEVVPAAGQLISPASGTQVNINVPFTDGLLLTDGGVAGHANEDSIRLGPAAVAGSAGGIVATGCLGSTVQIDNGGTGSFTGTALIQIITAGGAAEEIDIETNNGNGFSINLTRTAVQLRGSGGTPTLQLQTGSPQFRWTGTTWQIDNTFTSYHGYTLVDNGIPVEAGHADLTAQSAAKAATTLATPNATGRFRICAYLKVTTPATTSSILGAVTITYTDGTDSVAQSVVMQCQSKAGASETTDIGNTTTSILSGELFIFAKIAVAIQYAIAYTSVGGTAMQYEAHLTAEAM